MWMLLATALAGSESWTLSESSWFVDEPVRIERELSTFELQRGYAFRIEQDGAPVGAVFVGGGAWAISFETETDAIVAANRMVVLEDADPDALRPVVSGGEPLAIGIDRGWMAGLDVWDRLEPHLLRVQAHGGALYTERDGIDEIVVTGEMRLARARRIADEALRERTEWMRTHAFDPASLIAVDAWDGAADVLLADFRTDRAWDRYAGVDTAGADQRWLSYVHEPTGALSPDRHTEVFAAVDSDRGVDRQAVAVGRFEADAHGHRRAPVRIDLDEAVARHALSVEPGGIAVIDEAWADLAVRSVGGDQQVLWVDVPHTHQVGFGSMYPLDNGFELLGLTLPDGTPLEAIHLPLTGSQTEGRGDERTFAVRLPEPLEAGEVATVRVGWRDRHRYGRYLTLELNKVTQTYHLGDNTNLVRALPRVRGDGGRDFRGKVEVGMPRTGGHRAVASGDSEERWVDDAGWRWVRSTTRSRGAVLAGGIWTLHDEPGGAHWPAVQTALRQRSRDEAKQLTRNIHKLLALYQQIFPRYPAQRTQMLELVAARGQVLIRGADRGLVGIGSYEELAGMRPAEALFRDRYPHYEERALASVLAMHWLVDLGLSGEELALPEVLGPALGTSAIEAMYGAEAVEPWHEAMRRCADPSDRVVGPVLEAGVNGRCAGVHLMSRGLPARVGQATMNAAVADLLTGAHPATFDGLRAALEARSGEDLRGVFEPWVQGSVAPDVHVIWEYDPSGFVRGTATTNLPFGALDVPIQVGEERGWVHLIDGRARFEIPWEGPKPSALRIDPDDALLFRHTTAVEGAIPMA